MGLLGADAAAAAAAAILYPFAMVVNFDRVVVAAAGALIMFAGVAGVCSVSILHTRQR